MEEPFSVKESFYSLYTSVHIVTFNYMQELTLLKHWTFGLFTVGASASVTKHNNNNNNNNNNNTLWLNVYW